MTKLDYMEPKVVIEFDNPSKTYEPSGLVVGRVIIISSGQDGLHLTGELLLSSLDF